MNVWLVNTLARCAAFIAGLALVAAAPAAPTAPETDGALSAFVDGLMAARLRRDHIAGAAVVIVADGQVVVSRGYGYADVARRVPVDPATTMFRIASVTKLFTATAAMQQAEQGKLKLDADIASYLDFPVRRFAKTPLTMAHLLTHTAGFEEGVFGMFVHPGEARPLGSVLKATLPALVRAPGQQSAYSNHGMGLAGYVVERTSGERYQDYVNRHIFAPLGMTHSTAYEPVPARFAANIAKGYSFSGGKLNEQPQEIVNVAPAGSISASAQDMGRFMLAQLNGGSIGGARILTPTATATMQTCHFRADPRTGCMGYGFYQAQIAGQDAIAHGGDLNNAHSELVLVPGRRIGIFVVTNSAEGAEARDDFARQVLSHLFPPAARQPSYAADYAGPDTAADYAGAYLINRRPYSGMFAALGLGLQLSAEAQDARHLMLLDKRWRQIGAGVFTDDAPGGGDDRLIFRRDAGGKVTGAMISAFPFVESKRIGWIDTAVAAGVILALWAASGLGLGAMAWRQSRASVRTLAASAALMLAGLASIASRFLFAPSGPYGAGYTTPTAFLAGGLLLDMAAVTALIGAVLTASAWSGLNRVNRIIVIGYILATAALLVVLVRWHLVGIAF